MYYYEIKSVDLDGDEIEYVVEFGNGDTETTSLYSLGDTVTIRHTWNERRSYTIQVIAVDKHNGECLWVFLTVSMSKSKELITLPFLHFLEKLANQNPILDLFIEFFYQLVL